MLEEKNLSRVELAKLAAKTKPETIAESPQKMVRVNVPKFVDDFIREYQRAYRNLNGKRIDKATVIQELLIANLPGLARATDKLEAQHEAAEA